MAAERACSGSSARCGPPLPFPTPRLPRASCSHDGSGVGAARQPLFEHHFSPDEPFNPQFLIPERIIDSRDEEQNGACGPAQEPAMGSQAALTWLSARLRGEPYRPFRAAVPGQVVWPRLQRRDVGGAQRL